MKKVKMLRYLFLTLAISILQNYQLFGQITSGPTNVCIGDTALYIVTPDPFCLPSSNDWSIIPSIGGTIISGWNSDTVTVIWNLEGIFQLCQQPLGCPWVPMFCSTVSVGVIAPTTVDYTICTGECVTLGGLDYCSAGTFQAYVNEDSTGCDSLFTYIINAIPPNEADIGIVALGCGESLEVCGVSYSNSGNFTATCQSWLGCDSTVHFTIHKDDEPSVNAGLDRELSCMVTAFTLAGSGDIGPEFSYLWTTVGGNFISNTNTLSPVIDQAGTYCLTVTNALTGCSAADCLNVFAKPQLTVQGPDVLCEDGGTGTITLFWNYPAPPPYIINWSVNGMPQPPIYSPFKPFSLPVSIGQQGTHSFWIEYSDGCSSDINSIVIGATDAEADILLDMDGCAADSLMANLTGVFTPPLNYVWSNGGSSAGIAVTSVPTNYTVTISDENGCTWTATEAVMANYPNTCATLHGKVTLDSIFNCQFDTGESGLSGWLLVAEGTNTFYGTTAPDGSYAIPVLPGNYNLKLVTPNQFWVPCSNNLSVSLPSSGDSLQVDFSVVKYPGCPVLTVDISIATMRRCFNNFYHVQYKNEGVETAEDAYVEVQLDPQMYFISSPVPSTDLGGNRWRFDIGDVAANTSGSFFINAALTCNVPLNTSICTEAHIFPDSTCLPTSPTWAGGSLAVEPMCSDSVHFKVKNVGTGPTTSPNGFVVIEDAVMYRFGEIGILAAGESFELALPANGSTWRMEVDQVSYHPQPSQPVGIVEGCGTNQFGTVSTGFVNQFPLGDPEAWLDEDCTAATGSFDPNDKQGFPLGYSEEHLVKKNSELEYLIRFQNTGNDTALTVVVRDTLSSFLDIDKLRPGASSHPYEFEIYGTGILQFTFNDIMLPDSNANEVDSHGFISFSVPQNAELSPGKVVENKAGIYFDMNTPVITNTTMHTVAKPVVYSILQQTLCEGEAWNGNIYEADTIVFVRFDLGIYDSIVQAELQILPPNERALGAQICEGETYYFEGQSLGQSGNYEAILQAANGCDSIIHLDLVVLPATITEMSAEICGGDSFIFNGEALTQSGDYKVTFQNFNGCDSIVNFSLVVWPKYDVLETANICTGSTYLFNGQELDQPGEYTANLTSIHGCDSTVILMLNISDSIELEISASICVGDNFLFNNEELTQSGIYNVSFTSIGGCDSMVTLSLTVLPPAVGTQILSICEGETIVLNGEQISGADTLVYVIANGSINGCDSIVTIIIDILPAASSAFEHSICDGEIYEFNGQLLTNEGVYEATYSAANGCDSTMTLTLMVYPPTPITNQSLEVFQGYIYNGTTINADTLLNEHFLNVYGCDSTIITSFTVLPNASQDLLAQTSFEVFPNPTGGNFTIRFTLKQPSIISLKLLDVVGRKMSSTWRETRFEAGEHLLKINADDWPSGVYFVQFQTDGGMLTQKVVVD